jgi:hypothetical protein
VLDEPFQGSHSRTRLAQLLGARSEGSVLRRQVLLHLICRYLPIQLDLGELGAGGAQFFY